MQCAPEAAKIFSQYGAEKHQRNSISVLVELLCTLDSRLFSAGASRILVHALHATRLGRTNFPRDGPFSVTVWLSWVFARLIGLKTLCSSVVSMKTSAARRPEAFLTNCYDIFNVAPLNFSHSALRSFHFGFWLDCSPIWWCIQAHFLPNSQEDGVVQLPFRPALRLRLFSNGLLSSVLPLEPFLQSFPFSVSLKPETSWLFNSLNTLLLEER